MHRGGAVLAAIVEREPGRQVERRGARFLQHDSRVRRDPAASAGRKQRALAEPLAIGRIEKDQVARAHRARGAKVCGIAAQQLGFLTEVEKQLKPGSQQAADLTLRWGSAVIVAVLFNCYGDDCH